MASGRKLGVIPPPPRKMVWLRHWLPIEDSSLLFQITRIGGLLWVVQETDDLGDCGHAASDERIINASLALLYALPSLLGLAAYMAIYVKIRSKRRQSSGAVRKRASGSLAAFLCLLFFSLGICFAAAMRATLWQHYVIAKMSAIFLGRSSYATNAVGVVT